MEFESWFRTRRLLDPLGTILSSVAQTKAGMGAGPFATTQHSADAMPHQDRSNMEQRRHGRTAPGALPLQKALFHCVFVANEEPVLCRRLAMSPKGRGKKHEAHLIG